MKNNSTSSILELFSRIFIYPLFSTLAVPPQPWFTLFNSTAAARIHLSRAWKWRQRGGKNGGERAGQENARGGKRRRDKFREKGQSWWTLLSPGCKAFVLPPCLVPRSHHRICLWIIGARLRVCQLSLPRFAYPNAISSDEAIPCLESNRSSIALRFCSAWILSLNELGGGK